MDNLAKLFVGVHPYPFRRILTRHQMLHHVRRKQLMLQGNSKQECIPVGYVPSTAVGAGCLPKGVCQGLFRDVCVSSLGVYLGCVCQGGVWGCTPPPWIEFLTDACENITFLQLLLRTVINYIFYSFTLHYTNSKQFRCQGLQAQNLETTTNCMTYPTSCRVSISCIFCSGDIRANTVPLTTSYKQTLHVVKLFPWQPATNKHYT